MELVDGSLRVGISWFLVLALEREREREKKMYICMRGYIHIYIYIYTYTHKSWGCYKRSGISKRHLAAATHVLTLNQ